MKKKTYKPNHGIEAAEPRLLFSAGLEGVLATQDLGVPSTDMERAAVEQSVDRATTDNASTPAVEPGVELIFVDSDTPEYQKLLDDLLQYPDETSRYEVIVLDETADGITQITKALNNYTNLSAVHILSHGSDGAIDLGSGQLDAETVAANAEVIRSWSNAFSDSGDLMIYGCNLAASAEGKMLVNSLATLTGTDVAASDDLTGNAALGGDWKLEYNTGTIESTVAISEAAQRNWGNVLTVGIDNTTTDQTTGSSLTISHATSGTNRLMLVSVSKTNPGAESVTSVTYNGTALTFLGRETTPDTQAQIEIWALTAPDPGTHDVVVTMDGANASGTVAGVMTFTGVDQASPLGTFVSASNNASPTASVNVSSAVGDLVFSAVTAESAPDIALNVGANQTEHWEVYQSGDNNSAGSTEAGAAVVTASWDLPASNQWAIAGVSITADTTSDAPVAVDDNHGLEFDGIDDYISIADSAGLTMTNTVTMEAWINADPSTNVNRMIINKEGEYEVALFADGTINWAFANTDPGWTWHNTGYVVPDNTWTHIAVAYDNGKVSTYVNGNLVDVYNGSGALGDAHAALDELRIGGRSNNPAGKYFDGHIDDVRVWNTARTQAQIQANMDQVLTGGEAGLAGYWNFNAGSGTSVADITGNGNTGTLIDGGAGAAGPQWNGYSTDQNTQINIPVDTGVLVNDTAVEPPPAAIAGNTLNYDAANDSDGVWNDDNGTAGYDWTLSGFGTDTSHTTSPATAYPGITAAYQFTGSPASGAVMPTMNSLPGNPTDASASFELWFRPNTLTGTQMLFETGATVDGTSIYLNGTNLVFATRDNGAVPDQVSVDLATIYTDPTAEFIQLVGVIDMAGSQIELFVDGISRGTAALSGVDWAGGNASGLGRVNSSAAAGSGNFNGDIALLRFYEQALTAAEADTNFRAISNALRVTAVNGSPAAVGNPVALASGALLTLNVDGSFDYDPNGQFDYLAAGATATDSFTYQVADSIGGTDTATVSIVVTGTADAPVTDNVSATGNEDAASIAITLTGSDVDGTVDNFRLNSLPANGTLYLDAGLSIVAATATDYAATAEALTLYFVPNANWNGSTGFQFVAIDDGSLPDATPATATITVNAVNDVPVATANTVITNEDTAHTFVVGEFSYLDVEGDALVSVTLGNLNLAGGTLEHSGGTPVTNGMTLTAAQIVTLVYTPALDANGAPLATFDFTVNDADAGVTAAQMDIDVTPVNDVPVADAGGPYTIDEGEGVTLDASGSLDVDGDALTWSWDINNDGTFGDVTGVSPSLTWAQLQGFGIDDDGTYTIQVRVDDGNGTPDTASTTLTVNNVSPLLTTTGANSANEGQLFTLNLGASDPGNDTIGSWMINWGDGSIETFAGNPASVTHVYAGGGTYAILASATDEDGIHMQNELLVASFNTDSVLRFKENTAAFLQQIGSFGDGLNGPYNMRIGPDGNIYVPGYFSGNILRYDASGTFIDEFIPPGTGGLVNPYDIAFGPDGNLYVASTGNKIIRFDAGTGAFIDVFATTATDGLNGPIGLMFDSDARLYVSGYVTNNVLRYDISDGSVIDEFISPGAGGGNSIEAMTIGPDGHLYIVSFGNDAILRFDGSTGAFIDTFIDLSATGLDGPNGLAFGPDGNLYVTGYHSHQVQRFDGTTGAYIDDYVPAFTGGLARPGAPEFVAGHRVTVNGAPDLVATTADLAYTENDGAVAIDPALRLVDYDTPNMTSATVTISANYIVGEDVLAFVDTANISGSWDSLSGVLTLSGADTAAAYQAALRSVTYLNSSENPDPSTRTVEFTANDGAINSTVTSRNITVTPVNDVPVATASTVTTGEDTAYTFGVGDFGYTDVEGDALVSVTITNLNLAGGALEHSGGTAVTDGMTLTAAQIATLVYTPALDANGAPLATFDFTVNDADAGVTAAQMDIDVTPVNDAPVATASTVSTAEDTAYTFGVADFTYADVEGDALVSVTVTNLNLAGGTLEHSGGTAVTDGMTLTAAQIATLVYTPALDANGAPLTTFDFTVNDADAGVTAAQMDIDVTPVNDAPVTNNVSATGNEDAASIAITLTGGDIDGTVDNYVLNGLPANGTLYLDAGLTTVAATATDYAATAEALTLYFVPNANWNGITTFDFAARDDGGLLDGTPATATITVNAVNDVPVATASTVTTTEDNAYTFAVADFSYTDVEGDALVSVTINNLNLAGGTLEHSGGTAVTNGMTLTAAQIATLVYTPALDANGAPLATFDFTVNDADAGVTTAQMDIDVTPVNDAPVTDNVSATGNEDAASIAITLTGSDIDGTVD